MAPEVAKMGAFEGFVYKKLLGGLATAFGRRRDSFWAETRQLLGGDATAFGRRRDSFWAESCYPAETRWIATAFGRRRDSFWAETDSFWAETRQLLGGDATAFGRKVATRGRWMFPPDSGVANPGGHPTESRQWPLYPLREICAITAFIAHFLGTYRTNQEAELSCLAQR